MSLTNLYLDYNIEEAPEGHKHNREGWINCACPFCTGDPGYHLGYNEVQNYFYCWRCGHHHLIDTLTSLTKLSKSEVRNLSRQYRIRGGGGKQVARTSTNTKINIKPFKMPSGVVPLGKPHRRYLEKRNFNTDQLSKDWGVQGTSPTSSLDGIFYKYRIVVPIYWKGQIVSFQTRDYTNRQEKKYLACPQKREIVHHKHILYGNSSKWTDTGICVEGVFDVWRMGSSSFSTLGIGYTAEQVTLIASIFKKVIIVFDPEKQAQRQANKLKAALRARNVDASVYTGLLTDPADMSQEAANQLIKELNM